MVPALPLLWNAFFFFRPLIGRVLEKNVGTMSSTNSLLWHQDIKKAVAETFSLNTIL